MNPERSAAPFALTKDSGRALRLAIVTHALVRGDGQGRVNLEIAREALRRGHTVTAFATRIEPDLADAPSFRWVPISAGPLPSELLRNQVFAAQSALRLRRERPAPDVLLANGCITWAASQINAAHFVHGAWLRSPAHAGRSLRGPRAWYQRLYTRLNARWERHAFARARVVVAVSPLVARQLRAVGVPPQRIRVIANGVDLDEFHPGPADRGALGLPEGVPLALFAGDIRSPRKNLDTVLAALARTPDLHLAVVGDTRRSPYPALARRLGVAERVRFLGYRRDVAALMRASDLFAFPSRFEPFGLVVLEAMASGLPVVTTHATGASGLVTPDTGIVLADADDTTALAAALTSLAGDRARRQAMGRTARVAAERHGWAACAAAWVDLAETLAVSRRQSSGLTVY